MAKIHVPCLRSYHRKRYGTPVILNNLQNSLCGLYIGHSSFHICVFNNGVVHILVFLLQVELEKSAIIWKFLRVSGWPIWPTERAGV